MKKLVTIVALVCFTLALSAMAATMTGYISDSHCGVKHQDGSAASIKCVTSCVKSMGADPVFVSGDKVYKLSDKTKVMDYLGKKVTINGTMAEDTITITSVKPAK